MKSSSRQRLLSVWGLQILFKLNPRNVCRICHLSNLKRHSLKRFSSRLEFNPLIARALGKDLMPPNKQTLFAKANYDLRFEIWDLAERVESVESELASRLYKKQSSLDWMELNGALSEDQVGPLKRRASASDDSDFRELQTLSPAFLSHHHNHISFFLSFTPIPL